MQTLLTVLLLTILIWLVWIWHNVDKLEARRERATAIGDGLIQ